MHGKEKSWRSIPVKLTEAQRQAVAEIMPELADRLKLAERGGRTVSFPPDQLMAMSEEVDRAAQLARSGVKRNSLRLVLNAIKQAVKSSTGLGAIPASERIYQLKITLLEVQPPVWRRIQVRDCTLDKLHERIQTAMGWTNSHLHHFKIDETLFGDPLLLEENFEMMDYSDSTTTKLSEILPESGARFRFEYEYDFGSTWYHEVLFEGCLRAETGKRYPLCVEGARACPPEDSGGNGGYVYFLEALADPEHDQHDQLLEWIGGEFEPEAFDSEVATKRMRRGLPDWRKML